MSLVGTFSTYPPARSLISALPLADALHLGRTCTSMYGLVGGLLTPPMVDRLTELLVNLRAEQYFSLGSAPESYRKNRRFVELPFEEMPQITSTLTNCEMISSFVKWR